MKANTSRAAWFIAPAVIAVSVVGVGEPTAG